MIHVILFLISAVAIGGIYFFQMALAAFQKYLAAINNTAP